MMIRNASLLLTGILLIAAVSFPYRDGTYRGSSRGKYINEPYYGNSRITIENGKITKIGFVIRDSAKHVDFDSRYEKYFEGNDLYIEQCRENLIGLKSYPDSLIKYQDLKKVDAVSGATWAYNIFRASVKEALESSKMVK